MRERTCVGCGARAEEGALVRLVAAGDRLALDPARRLPGRGAWLHPERACLDRALRRRALARALRREGLAVDGVELARLLTGIGRRD